MSRLRWQSRLACRWSVELLFPTVEEALLFAFRPDLPHGYQSYGFLWTWTFPDARGQTSATYALACWAKHARWLKDTGKRLVRSIERGGKSGHYHFHAVTDQRWDINEVLAHAKSCGFGRVNVEVIPRDRVYYVAKYIGKSGRWPIPKGVRLWAAIGFKGIAKANVHVGIKTLTVGQPETRPLDCSHVRWTYEGETIAEKLLRPYKDPTEPNKIHTMNVTKENLLHLAGLLAGGAILALAEYRTCEGREMTFDEENRKTGEKTGKKVTRKLVEHGVEIGSQQITVTEWLPDTADLKDIKAPAAKGEAVVVEIDGFSKRYGITAKSIKSIATFGGKLS